MDYNMKTATKARNAACAHLVAFGGWDYTEAGRAKVAAALRAMRRVSREWAQTERRHMLFISGQFPVKVTARTDAERIASGYPLASANSMARDRD